MTASAKPLKVNDAVSRIRRVEDALFWRCAALCQQASGQFQLGVAERAVLNGIMAHYRAGMPVDPAFKLAASTIIACYRQQLRSDVLHAAALRRDRRPRKGRKPGRGSAKARLSEPDEAKSET